MQAIWSGVIGFGLVNIPVRLYSPAKEEMLDLDFLHKKDRSTVRYARICRAEEKEIPWDEIERGYKIGNQYVVLTDKDFAKANARKTKTIDILHFSAEEEIDSIYFEKPYYLEPEPRSEKAYALLHDALKSTHKVGVASFVLRHRELLVVLKPYKNILVIEQLRYAHEIHSPDALEAPKKTMATHKELGIAIDLINKSTEKFKPDAHKDYYLKELQALIREKAKGIVPKKRGKEPTPTKVTDLMSALKKSLAERERGARR